MRNYTGKAYQQQLTAPEIMCSTVNTVQRRPISPNTTISSLTSYGQRFVPMLSNPPFTTPYPLLSNPTLMLTMMEQRRAHQHLQLLNSAIVNAELAVEYELHGIIAESMLASHHRSSRFNPLRTYQSPHQELFAAQMRIPTLTQQQHPSEINALLQLDFPPASTLSGSRIQLPTTFIPTSTTPSMVRPAALCFPRNQDFQGINTFPMILHLALTQLELTTTGTVTACFLPDGKSFQIRNQFLFEKHILPRFFPKMKSYASFQRQLNLYNFVRIRKKAGTADCASYQHNAFLRDFPALSCGMRRTKNKNEVVGRNILLPAPSA
jgi:hypothetical protein